MSGRDQSRVIAEIDHLLTYVADLAQASDVYRTLGFTLTPASHIEPMGIVNRLVLLTPTTTGAANFIELMAVSDRARLPKDMARLLTGDEAIKSMVMLTHDAARSREHFVALGYDFAAPVHVRREWRLSEDESVFPEFDVLLPVAAPLVFNACQYRNVELYLRPEFRVHPNTAVALDAVFAVTDDVTGLAARYARLFGCDVVRRDLEEVVMTPAAVDFVIMSPARGASRLGLRQRPVPVAGGAAYVGFSIRVDNLATCRLCLSENGVLFGEIDGGVVASACGNLLRFHDGQK